MNTKAKGYLLGAVAAATYGTNPLFALPLYEAGMNPDSVLLFRYLFAIPILGVMLRARGRSFKVPRSHVGMLLLMGILVALSSLTLFLSYNYMDAGIASTLLFVYPILVALIMAAGFSERLSPMTGLCILLACGGIGLLYRSADGSTLSLTGSLLVLASALSYAIYIVAARVSRLREIPTLSVTFYVLSAGLLLFVARIACGEALIMPDLGICGATCWPSRSFRPPFRSSAPRAPSSTSDRRPPPFSEHWNPSRQSFSVSRSSARPSRRASPAASY